MVSCRSIIAECLASFLYVFIVCGAAAGAGVGVSSVLLASALASGFAITTLTQCFSHISGKNIFNIHLCTCPKCNIGNINTFNLCMEIVYCTKSFTFGNLFSYGKIRENVHNYCRKFYIVFLSKHFVSMQIKYCA